MLKKKNYRKMWHSVTPFLLKILVKSISTWVGIYVFLSKHREDIENIMLTLVKTGGSCKTREVQI